MAINYTLRVQPETLYAKANEVKTSIEAMARDVDNLGAELREMDAYWKGDARNQLYAEYNDNLNEINSILERLKTYGPDLMRIAGIYEQYEHYNETIAGATQENVPLVM